MRSNVLVRVAAYAFVFAALVLAPLPLAWGQQAPDLSKLKRGDKIEYKRFSEWKTYEFVQRETFGRLKIRDPQTGWERTVSADEERLPLPVKAKTDEKAAAAHPENPFATSDEKKPVLKPRTWSDKSGKFKIEGTLVRIDGANVVLVRSDTKEITVPLEKLSEADKKYVADYQAGKSLDGKTPGKTSGPQERTLLPLTPTDLNTAKLITIDEAPEWKYEPDAAPSPKPLQNVRVALQSVDTFFRASKLFLLPEEKKAFVITSIGHGPDATSVVQACDLGRGKLEGVAPFPEGEAPLAISPDGKYVLGRTDKFHLGTKGELRLYARDGEKIDQVACWQPYNHHRSTSGKHERKTATARRGRGTGLDGTLDEEEKPGAESDDAGGRPELTAFADVEWAEFIDNNHILTMGHDGELAMWKAPEIEPLYVVKARISQPAISPGRNYVAVAVKEGIAILRVKDGELAGLISLTSDNSSGSVAFRPDGKRLVLLQGGQWSRVRVWDLESQEIVRDFAVKSVTGGWMTNATWTTGDYLLTGSTVIDLARRIPIWRYTALSDAWQFYGDKAWFVGGGLGRESKVLTSAKVPPKEALDAVAKLNPEDLLVIRPGLEVEVDLQGGTPEDLSTAREAVFKRLAENDVRVVPQSKVRLVGRIQPGETKTMKYSQSTRSGPHFPHFGSVGGEILEKSVTEQVLSLSYEIDGKSVWKYEQRTSPPWSLSIPPGKSIDEALNDYMQQNATSFGQIWVPSYVAEVPGGEDKKSTGAIP